MLKTVKPNLHLSILTGYKNGKFQTDGKDMIFSTEQEAVKFLASHNIPAYNCMGEPIPGVYMNKYMDNQALNGVIRTESTRERIFTNIDYNSKEKIIIAPGIMVGKYCFWWDTAGQPMYDVRLLKDNVNKEYEDNVKDNSQWIYIKSRRKSKKQGRPSHIRYASRRSIHYIQRKRIALGLAVDTDEEYRKFAKPAETRMNYFWDDEYGNGRGSSGWKDNPGSKYRHQWEAKQDRKYKKLKNDKNIVMMSYSKTVK